MATTHPAGTPVDSIRGFDRTTKVSFHCPAHPELGSWHSKDPFVSSWFGPADPCSCPVRGYVTSEEYTSLR